MGKGFARLSNVDMYYEIEGTGEPLLLIHGIDSDSRLWDSQFYTFAKAFKTIRFDLRGFGSTTMPAGEFQLLDDLHDLLAFLEIDSAHILGYSYGGTVAPSFAIKNPDSVKSLMLVSAGLVGHQWSEMVNNYFIRFQETYKENNYDEMMRILKWKSVYGPYRKEEGLEHICTLLDDMFLQALSITPRNGIPLPTGDTRSQLVKLAVPTLILVGEKDFEDYHQIANFYHAELKNSEKRIIPQVGHLMNLENPDHFNNVIMNFLQGLEKIR